MNGRAVSFGAISIVNAIAGGKGATAGICLKTEARVEMSEGKDSWDTIVNGERADYRLPAATARQMLLASKLAPEKYGGTIETRSSIPIGVGLKSSSSASVAISLAVVDALGKDHINTDAILCCSVRASLRSKVSITGALDDAASCLLGGVNVADNLRVKLIRSRPMTKRLKVLIRIPHEESRRGSMNLSRAKKLRRVCDSLITMTLGGAHWEAMTLNGILYSHLLGYSTRPAQKAIELGALGAGLSGTGPAIAAVFDSSQSSGTKQLKREWSSDGSTVLETKTNNERGGFFG